MKTEWLPIFAVWYTNNGTVWYLGDTYRAKTAQGAIKQFVKGRSKHKHYIGVKANEVNNNIERDA